MNLAKLSAAKIIAGRMERKNTLYYGWIVLFLSALGLFFSAPGQTYFTAVFIESYIAEFGWSRAGLSSLYSIATLISGLLLFQIGRLADRFGQKKIIIAAAFVLGIGTMWTSLVSQIWMIFVAFFVGRIAGQGSMILLPSTVVPHWFVRKRALAFSLMSLGGFCGSALVPPLNSFLIDQIGWRMTWRLWGLLLWLLFVPLIVIFHANKPQDLDIKIKESARYDIKKVQSKKTDYTKPVSWDFKSAIKTRSFWGTIYVQMLMPMISTGITFHFVSLMISKGIDERRTPFLLSIIAFTSLASTLMSGYLLAKIKPQQAAVIISVLITLNLLLLLFLNNYFLAILFTVVQGIIGGIQAVWAGLVWPEYFGTRHLGSIRGLAMAAMVISSALGPLPFGFIFDRLQSYNVAIVTMMFMAVMGILAALISPKPGNPPQFKNAFEP